MNKMSLDPCISKNMSLDPCLGKNMSLDPCISKNMSLDPCKSKKFRYPTDTDQFSVIRENGLFYVDKTELIYKLVKSNRYVFLARPRRFGKSLLCTTLKAYFEGKKELFEGLAMERLETEWKQYPVLHFDMSQMRNCTSLDEMREVLADMLFVYEQEYGFTKRVDEFGTRLSNLIHYVHDSQQQEVVVIFDEYDTPLMHNLYNKEMREGVRAILRGFYQTVKKDGRFLRFVFITGVTKFSQLSIFSELNNLMQISMLDEYSGLCGITQKELDTVMRPCIEKYAEDLEISTDEAYALLKKNYDGYHFSAKSEDVYAPFSLLRALACRNTSYYWFESGTSASLIEHLKQYPELNVLDYDGVQVGIDEFNIPCEEAETPMPLLYQSGYLTIASYDKRLQTYTLHFPNEEVRQGMIRCLMPMLMRRTTADGNALVRGMGAALFDGDLSGALKALRSYIAKIPFDIITKEEWEDQERREAFYKLLMYMAFSMLHSLVDTEVKSILGRADVVIKTDTYVYVLELKVDKSVDDALAQIDDKGYAIPFEADGRTLLKCGVMISSKERTLTHWKITDADGVVLCEEKF